MNTDKNLNLQNEEQLQDLADNLAGVTFSGGEELSEAVEAVVTSELSFLEKVRKFFLSLFHNKE